MKHLIITMMSLFALLIPGMAQNVSSADTTNADNDKYPLVILELSDYDTTFVAIPDKRRALEIHIIPAQQLMFIKGCENATLQCPAEAGFICYLSQKNEKQYFKFFPQNSGSVRRTSWSVGTYKTPVSVDIKRGRRSVRKNKYQIFTHDKLCNRLLCEKDKNELILCRIGVRGDKVYYRVDLSEYMSSYKHIYIRLTSGGHQEPLIFGTNTDQ